MRIAKGGSVSYPFPVFLKHSEQLPYKEYVEHDVRRTFICVNAARDARYDEDKGGEKQNRYAQE